MSQIKVINYQVGINSDPTKNFTINVPSTPDGTLRLSRGNPGATTNDIFTINADNSITFNQSVINAVGNSGASSFRNRMINGAFNINQYGVGALTTDQAFMCDRWRLLNQPNASTYSAQAVPNTTLPGVPYQLNISNGVFPITPSATQYFGFYQNIEGIYVTDFKWGTSRAIPIIMSFYVNSTVTGTFSVLFRSDGAGTRTYGSTFTVNSANTWERKTIVVPGDTSGTWTTGTGIGLQIIFGLSVGSNFLAPANTWTSGNYLGVTGQTNFTTFSNSTISFTGIQLEPGTIATPFELRFPTVELELCQRYYYQFSTGNWFGGVTYTSNGDTRGPWYQFPVTMRVNPVVSFSPSSWTVIGTGDAAPVVNVIVTPTVLSATNNGFTIAQVNSSNLTPAGQVCSWGSNTGVTISVNAEV